MHNTAMHLTGNNDVVTSSNMVALEIGKDFSLPGSGDDREAAALADTKNFLSEYQQLSKLHPNDGEVDHLQSMRRTKNRLAAQKCREKKKERIRILEEEIKVLSNDNYELKQKNMLLEDKIEQLQETLKELVPNNEQCPGEMYPGIQYTPVIMQGATVTQSNVSSAGHLRKNTCMAPNLYYPGFTYQHSLS